MEQRHLAAKSHWYHETQSRPSPADAHPLVPEAAQVEDAFLLDCPWPTTLHPAHHPWLATARQLSGQLLPPRVAVNRRQTLSSYDRLSTALTVAQVYGVQRLCNHYSARLAPEPGPDSSRESNHRLTQITQFARQLAGNPGCIDLAATRQLLAVGLTEDDVVTFVHLIGFIGFQARVIAALHAFNGLPVRWLPGMDIQADAPPDSFSSTAAPALALSLTTPPPEQLTFASRELLADATPDTPLHHLAPLLARDPDSWRLLTRLQRAVPAHSSAILVRLLSARVNGSVPCFTAASQQWTRDNTLVDSVRNGERAITAWSHGQAEYRGLIEPLLLMIRAPSRFGAAHVAGLREHGVTADNSLALLTHLGIEGWVNRLNISLYGRL
ncbi:hypothetical protein F9C28_01350 [Shimwellia pseudoproteus]|uniref:carboxymuconolactone decarboxylase family protein n=1 Tax=Shimwellia pseudoproteus TaxID=570012 RepID=UPI0018EE3723|nr:hypothetical protein [Shimwellia pseudoproteus]MBJ3813606.1 hypothetical protein [Shimwellia pseudoproteus]